MKKTGIILINLFLLIFVLIVLEFLCYFKDTNSFKNRPEYSLYKEKYSLYFLKKNMRKPVGLEYKKSPVIIYGCSYAYGFALEDKDTFSTQLSEYTKRPVYNFAISSKGLQDALFLIKNDEKIKPEPQYVFYVFINDHVRRMYINCNKIDNVEYLTYREEKNILKENNLSYFEKFYLIRNLKNYSYYCIKNLFKKQIFNMVKLYFISIKNEVEKKYPNAKFIVIDYENGYESYLIGNKKKILEEEGIEIINLNEVFQDKLKMNKYKNPKNIDSFRHPNRQAWELIVKYLSEKYEL